MNLMFKTVLILVCLCLSVTTVMADSPAPMLPKVTTSKQGMIWFKMIPVYDRGRSGYGVAYRLGKNGESTELWRVKGWYAFKVYLSNDGKYLVRLGNWAEGQAPAADDLAVAFYKNGKELKRYSTADLIEDKNSVIRSISHYQWKRHNKGYPKLDWDNEFLLHTIEDKLYHFDSRTGEITRTTVVKD